ncbi:MAG: class I SAM-dependent methyltransferase [Acidimicrobiales bacterium]|jgi:SAM-dependent methyltransferase|nr:class I SAM-dependent methyltransferase [Acidimicrobiales bacterium]
MADSTGSDDITAGHPTTRRLKPASAPQGLTGPLSATFPSEAYLPFDTVSYGPDVPTEQALRLLGNVEGRRILELGCGAGHAAVALAKRGAHVISVSPSFARLEVVRSACEREEVRIETHQSDLADLAFIRADTVDLVLAVYSVAGVDDLDRLLRQVHRVLRTESPFVFSVPHPAFSLLDPTSDQPLQVQRSYFDRTPITYTTAEGTGREHPRPISELFLSLSRANFRVDTLLEPEPDRDGVHSRYWTTGMNWVPSTLIIRARKEGL